MFKATDLEYVELQLALEGIGFDDRRRLIRIPASAAEDIPRLYICQVGASWARFYRSDVPEPVVNALDLLSDETCFEDLIRTRATFGQHNPCIEVWVGASYVFREIPAASANPGVRRLTEIDRPLAAGLDPDLLSAGRPIYAMLVDGRIASACVSVRENSTSAEAWVQTSPSFRRQGFAFQVTSAWARDVLALGKIAFYSHHRDNVASRAVAVSLGLRQFVEGVGYL